MIKNKVNQSGFSAVAVVLIAVIIGLIGFTGWYVYNSTQKNDNSQETAGQQSNPTKTTPTPTKINEIASWKTYQNKTAGFSFKYPNSATVFDSTSYNYDRSAKGDVIVVTTRKVSDIKDQPMGMDKATAEADLAALAKGDPSTTIGMPVSGSNKMVNVTGGYGKTETILSELEICNVQAKRLGVFYKNGYQVLVSFVNFDIDAFQKADPSYFYQPVDCSGENVYKNAGEPYYQSLVKGSTSTFSQKWFTDFDKIISTFKFE